MNLVAYTAASSEPVSVADARLACRIDTDDMDAELASLIAAAREEAEHITGRVYREQVLRTTLSGWPAFPLQLEAPGASAVAITYRSAAAPNAWTALSASVFRFAGQAGSTTLILAVGQTLPDLAGSDFTDRVRIEVTATPETQAPESVRRYILAYVAAGIAVPEGVTTNRLMVNRVFERALDRERLWA